MSKIAADETKAIALERWEEWCDTFSSGNRGRLLRIDIVSDKIGAESMAADIPLVAIDYDPVGKGNDMVITYGEEADPSRHLIAAPVALWQGQDENGVVVGLEIEDVDGDHVIITFS